MEFTLALEFTFSSQLFIFLTFSQEASLASSSVNSYFPNCSQTFIKIAHSSRFFIILHESSYAL